MRLLILKYWPTSSEGSGEHARWGRDLTRTRPCGTRAPRVFTCWTLSACFPSGKDLRHVWLHTRDSSGLPQPPCGRVADPGLTHSTSHRCGGRKPGVRAPAWLGSSLQPASRLTHDCLLAVSSAQSRSGCPDVSAPCTSKRGSKHTGQATSSWTERSPRCGACFCPSDVLFHRLPVRRTSTVPMLPRGWTYCVCHCFMGQSLLHGLQRRVLLPGCPLAGCPRAEPPTVGTPTSEHRGPCDFSIRTGVGSPWALKSQGPGPAGGSVVVLLKFPKRL